MSYAYNHQQSSFRSAVLACTALMAMTLVAFAVPVAAQEQGPEQSPPPQQSQPQPETLETVGSADVTELELEQFAKSALDILEIQEAVEEKLASVQDTNEADRIKTEANETMVETIKSNGMEVERYNLIARSVGEDAELRQRLQAKSLELRDESSPN